MEYRFSFADEHPCYGVGHGCDIAARSGSTVAMAAQLSRSTMSDSNWGMMVMRVEYGTSNIEMEPQTAFAKRRGSASDTMLQMLGIATGRVW